VCNIYIYIGRIHLVRDLVFCDADPLECSREGALTPLSCLSGTVHVLCSFSPAHRLNTPIRAVEVQKVPPTLKRNISYPLLVSPRLSFSTLQQKTRLKLSLTSTLLSRTPETSPVLSANCDLTDFEHSSGAKTCKLLVFHVKQHCSNNMNVFMFV